jgi:hypothetical protein
LPCHVRRFSSSINPTSVFYIQLKLSQLCYPFSDIASRIKVVEYGSKWL